MRKPVSLGAALLLIAALIQVITMSAASAGTWPLTVPTGRVYSVIAKNNDSLSLISCNPGSSPAYRVESAELRTAFPAFSNTDGNQCAVSSTSMLSGIDEVLAKSGLLISYRQKNALVAEIYAYKNGRLVWIKDISAANDCTPGSSDYRPQTPRSMSIGSDGNLYMVIGYESAPSYCNDRFIAVNPKTGATVKTVLSITPEPTTFEPHIWTYAGKILILDRQGVLRTFSYAGVEDISKQYAFTLPTGAYPNQAIADEVGNVFMNTYGGSYPSVLYRKANGDSGLIADATGNTAQLIPTGDGNVEGIYPYAGYNKTLSHFNTSTDTHTTITVTAPTGYSQMQLTNYATNASGDRLFAWTARDSSYTGNVIVQMYDASLSTTVTLFQTSTDSMVMQQLPYYLSNAIFGGYLYLPICYDAASNCVASTNPADTVIQKIDIDDFGAAVPNLNGYGSYEFSDKQQYVAMGDSFSSGEGNPAFDDLTDSSDINGCHRSLTDAYPVILESILINTRLVDFAACSGATTNDILGISETDDPQGKWNEPAQLNALSSDTDIVTITIGGNDVGFASYVLSCTASQCGPGYSAYVNMMSRIFDPDFKDALVTTYSEILRLAPNAQLYVGDYPFISGEDEETCGVLDVSGARLVQDSLNSVILSAFNEVDENSSRIHIVRTNASPAPFDNKHLCSEDPYFHGYTGPPNVEYSFHPNTDGHEAYAEVFEDVIS